MSGWAWFWLSWFLGVVGSFGIAEFIALRRAEHNDTLSEQVWLLLKVSKWVYRIAFATFGMFILWLFTHFFSWGVV